MSVELVVEDGSDGAVAEGSDLDGARGSGLDTERAEGFDQSQNAEAGAKAEVAWGIWTGDKWNFCLRAASMRRIRRDHDETSETEPHGCVQGEGGLGGLEGREDTFGAGAVF